MEVGESDRGGLDIRLKSQPASDVTVNVESNDTGVFTVSPTSFTFTPLNWNVDQGPDITPVQDADMTDDTGTLTLSGTDVTAVTVTVLAVRWTMLSTRPVLSSSPGSTRWGRSRERCAGGARSRSEASSEIRNSRTATGLPVP